MKRIRAAPQQSINPSLIYGPSNAATEVLNFLATPPMTLESIDAIMFDLPAIPTPALDPAPRARQRRTTPAVPEIEPDASPNRQALHAIVSKYFTSYRLCRSIVNRLDTLPIDASVTLSELMVMATTKTRPDQEARMLMVEELRNANLFEITIGHRNNVLMKKVSD